METLDHNYELLCQQFPEMVTCSKGCFMQVLGDICTVWVNPVKARPGAAVSNKQMNSLVHAVSDVNDMKIESDTPSHSDGGNEYEPSGHGRMASKLAMNQGRITPRQDAEVFLNAGQAVDMTLHVHWTMHRTLFVEVGDLESFVLGAAV